MAIMMKNKGGAYNTKDKIKNPGSKCADCIYHECGTTCMKKPQEMCKGVCTFKYERKKCYASGRTCKYFKQIDWSDYYGNRS